MDRFSIQLGKTPPPAPPPPPPPAPLTVEEEIKGYLKNAPENESPNIPIDRLSTIFWGATGPDQDLLQQTFNMGSRPENRSGVSEADVQQAMASLDAARNADRPVQPAEHIEVTIKTEKNKELPPMKSRYDFLKGWKQPIIGCQNWLSKLGVEIKNDLKKLYTEK